MRQHRIKNTERVSLPLPHRNFGSNKMYIYIFFFSDHKNLLQIESALKEEIEKKKKALDDLEIERDFINENGPRVLEQISKDAL